MTINIGQRLAAAMAAKGIRPYELSQMTGISRSNISNYLKNKYSPKSDNIAKLAQALDVSEYYLLGLEDLQNEHSDVRSRVNELCNHCSDDQLEKVERFIIHVVLIE